MVWVGGVVPVVLLWIRGIGMSSGETKTAPTMFYLSSNRVLALFSSYLINLVLDLIILQQLYCKQRARFKSHQHSCVLVHVHAFTSLSRRCHTGKSHGIKLQKSLGDLVTPSNGPFLPILVFQSFLVTGTWLCKWARASESVVSRLLALYKAVLVALPGSQWSLVHTCSWPYRWWAYCIWRSLFSSPFPPFSLLFSLSLLVQYILVHFIYGRRYICSFSFQTQLAKISLKDICVLERRRGYGSLSNAGDVIQYFNPRHFMNSSHISWSHCRYFLPPNPQHLKSCENLSCCKAQEWKAWKCATVVIKNINNTNEINSKSPAFTEH